MNEDRPYGIYLFKKNDQDAKVLKDLLQFLKKNEAGKFSTFSYIEAETSLHPQLTLWENIQIEIGPIPLKDAGKHLIPEISFLMNLIKNPSIKTNEAQSWERFIISFTKALLGPSRHLLLDINEEHLSPFLIQQIKKSVLLTSEKTVYLATAQSSIWIDCAHSIVDRKEYEFEVTRLGPTELKKKLAA